MRSSWVWRIGTMQRRTNTEIKSSFPCLFTSISKRLLVKTCCLCWLLLSASVTAQPHQLSSVNRVHHSVSSAIFFFVVVGTAVSCAIPSPPLLLTMSYVCSFNASFSLHRSGQQQTQPFLLVYSCCWTPLTITSVWKPRFEIIRPVRSGAFGCLTFTQFFSVVRVSTELTTLHPSSFYRCCCCFTNPENPSKGLWTSGAWQVLLQSTVLSSLISFSVSSSPLLTN